LRHYRYDVDPDTGQFSRQPLRDQASNASDALRYCAVAMNGARRAGYKTPEPGPRPLYALRGYGWMRA
jgi:phage terminase large subunit